MQILSQDGGRLRNAHVTERTMNLQTLTRQFFCAPGPDEKSYITICFEQTAAEVPANGAGSYYQRTHPLDSSNLKIIAALGFSPFDLKCGIPRALLVKDFLLARETISTVSAV